MSSVVVPILRIGANFRLIAQSVQTGCSHHAHNCEALVCEKEADLRRENEGVAMARAHDAEVSVVQCRDRGDVQTFGDGDNARVHGTEVEIVILLEQLDDPVPVVGREIYHRHLPCRD